MFEILGVAAALVMVCTFLFWLLYLPDDTFGKRVLERRNYIPEPPPFKMKLEDADVTFQCQYGHRFHSSLTLLKPLLRNDSKKVRYVNHVGQILEGIPLVQWNDSLMACPKCGKTHLMGFKIVLNPTPPKS